LADYYEAVVRESGAKAGTQLEPKLAANWVMGELAAALNRDGLDIDAVASSGKFPAERLAGLLRRIADQTISGKIAKEVFEVMWSSGSTADAIIEQKGLKQITDSSAIEKAIDEVMAKHPGQLADFRAGKDKLFGFFVGQVMKAMAGKGNPALVNEVLKGRLSS
jgi:aspartyl-tRNA(Asn)/glutamyl-tRNA(Gln) amidotransferase subunit B